MGGWAGVVRVRVRVTSLLCGKTAPEEPECLPGPSVFLVLWYFNET